MANYHILDGRADGNYYTVVFHLPVPNITNAVGFNYRAVMAAQLSAEWISAVPHITTTEDAQIKAGELYELSWGYDTHPGISLAEKRDELDARFATFSIGVIAQIEARFEFYGFDRDVP